MVSIVFVTERKYIHLTDCVYSVARPFQGGSHRSASKCCTVLRGKARSALCRGDCRIIPFASFDRYVRIPLKEPTFRQESRYSGKRVYIPAEASSSRWAESFRGSD